MSYIVVERGVTIDAFCVLDDSAALDHVEFYFSPDEFGSRVLMLYRLANGGRVLISRFTTN